MDIKYSKVFKQTTLSHREDMDKMGDEVVLLSSISKFQSHLHLSLL